MLDPVALPVVVHLRVQRLVLVVDVVGEQLLQPLVLGERDVRTFVEGVPALEGERRGVAAVVSALVEDDGTDARFWSDGAPRRSRPCPFRERKSHSYVTQSLRFPPVDRLLQPGLQIEPLRPADLGQQPGVLADDEWRVVGPRRNRSELNQIGPLQQTRRWSARSRAASSPGLTRRSPRPVRRCRAATRGHRPRPGRACSRESGGRANSGAGSPLSSDANHRRDEPIRVLARAVQEEHAAPRGAHARLARERLRRAG